MYIIALAFGGIKRIKVDEKTKSKEFFKDGPGIKEFLGFKELLKILKTL